MSLQNKYKRTPKEPPQKKGSSEVVSQMVGSDDKKTSPDARETKKATFVLDADLHKQLRIHAAMNNTTMLEIVEKALKKYMNE